MEVDTAIATVLTLYPAVSTEASLAPLDNGTGFSGAALWRVASLAGTFCLRRWPREAVRPRIDFVHDVLHHVRGHGFQLASVPLKTRDGASVVLCDGFYWELEPWMPGEANYRTSPSDEKLASAMETLAQWHQLARSCPLVAKTRGESPGLKRRLERLREGMAGGFRELANRIGIANGNAALNSPSRRILELVIGASPAIECELRQAGGVTTRLQPCIADIRQEHVLFEGQRVSGIVDFDSIRIDSPACDVARLLGSMGLDDPRVWQSGIDSYMRTRPLSTEEHWLLGVFDRSTVLLAGINWLEWVYREGRVFANEQAVVDRLEEICLRLESLSRRRAIGPL